MSKFKTLLLFTYILFAKSCSTPKEWMLTPSVPPQYVGEDGSVTSTIDSVSLTYTYLFATKEYWSFNIKVENKSKTPVNVNPNSFYYQVADEKNKRLSTPIFAHSVEYMEHDTDIKLRRELKKRQPYTLSSDTKGAEKDTVLRGEYREVYLKMKKEFSEFLLKTSVVDSIPKYGVVYFPKTDTARVVFFNFKMGNLEFTNFFKNSNK